MTDMIDNREESLAEHVCKILQRIAVLHIKNRTPYLVHASNLG